MEKAPKPSFQAVDSFDSTSDYNAFKETMRGVRTYAVNPKRNPIPSRDRS